MWPQLPAHCQASTCPWVPMNLETLGIILPYAFILAAIGLIESLLTLSLVDELTQTRGRGNKECVAQGVANTVTGVFGGMGGCAMIGQSMINVNAGGRGPTFRHYGSPLSADVHLSGIQSH